MKNQVKDLNFSEKYCKACMERDVPASILVKQMQAYDGKAPEEQRALKDQFAEEILKKYPKKQRQMIG